ncbi:Lrp/AsnC family transcriptional regulator [Mycobacterium marinum]|uniref:Lrp/AsnC family transcriptional regulator n=1 Tax=Mycobacterium marinum TaxID=1781 RepID=UPI003561756D
MDDIDSEIVEILGRDGRASFSAMGRAIGLSTNAVGARVRRLETTGVILGYRAVLAAEKAPSGGIEAFVDVRLRSEQDGDQFLAWAAKDPAISDAVHVTGPYDYLLHIRVRDTADLDRLLRRLKAAAGVAQTQTRIALRSQH